jgi:mono/diheme cytochrome c family protein
MRRGVVLGAVLAILALAMGVGAWASHGSRSTTAGAAGAVARIDPHVAAGAHDFVQFACAACHGSLGRGGVSPYVPALKGVGKTLTVATLTRIITHGLGESKNPKRPFMPVWGPVISKTQVADLVAYIRAGLPQVQYATPVPIPGNQGPVVAGMAAYVHYGCINCHGPNGLGGVPNPQAPDKAIPPLSGQDFRAEFNTDAKILEFIRSGSVIDPPLLERLQVGDERLQLPVGDDPAPVRHARDRRLADHAARANELEDLRVGVELRAEVLAGEWRDSLIR